MGNSGSRRRQGSRRTHQPPPPPPQPANNYIFAAASPYPTPPPPTAPGYYQYQYQYQYQQHPPPPGYYPPHVRMPLPAPYDHHHQPQQPNWGRYPCVTPQPPPAPYVDHQKAVTIRNDINLKKDTLTLEPDVENPGKFLLAFTFDATLPGSITVIYFAKEGDNCKLTPTKEDILPPVTVHFEKGLGQKFRQPSGTGIDFSMFEESELMKRDTEVCPLAVKADACPAHVAETETETETGSGGNPVPDNSNSNSQITQAVFEKDKGEYKVKVLKQILWVNGMRYELQEIYGIGNTVEGDFDGNDPGKECVICLSEPRDTTVLPCRHMCMCSECAKVLRFQTNRCPICRQPVERLLEIKVNNGTEEEKCP